MARNLQRLSNLVGTFGPGAMLDLPTRSVLVGGLERWDMRQGAFKPIEEAHLAKMIERMLKDAGRLDPGYSLSLGRRPSPKRYTAGSRPVSPSLSFRRGSSVPPTSYRLADERSGVGVS